MKRIIQEIIKVTFLCFTCLLLGVNVYAQQSTSRINEGYRSDNLDGLDKIPEWLMMQVEGALPSKGLNVWIPSGNFKTSSLVRVPRFPKASRNIESLEPNRLLELEVIRNEQVSAQLAVAATDTISNLRADVGNLKSSAGSVIKAKNVQVRFVKYVPVTRAFVGQTFEGKFVGNSYEEVAGEKGLGGVSGFGGPDVVGDPLVDLDRVDVPMLRAQPIWFTLHIPEQNQAGVYTGEIKIKSDQFDTFQINLKLRVGDYRIPDAEKYNFKLGMWLNPFSVADYYNVKLWSKAHWQLLSKYFDDLSSRGQKVIMASIVDKPWKVPWLNDELRSQTYKGYKSMIKWQLLKSGQWSFDYNIFDQYVETALKHGNGPYISAYSMLVFRGPQRLTYYDEEKATEVVEYLKISDEKFKEVWSIFLKNFSEHLRKKGWLDQTYLSFDERPEETVNKVFNIVKEASPELYRNKSIGRPIKAFAQTCCSATHPNRYTYSPAVESYLIPWIVLKRNLNGYRDWAYNSWPQDIYKYPVFLYPQGDEYWVYPGNHGPLSSIRWELLKEGVEDFELVQKLKKMNHYNKKNEVRAIQLMTRHLDGRIMNLQNITKAKHILFDQK